MLRQGLRSLGGEHIITNTCPQNYKFTSKERDSESGLDDFEARYYSSQFGRFHSADWSSVPAPVPCADLGNSQTLNLYAYVKNNPLNLSDPTGHFGHGPPMGLPPNDAVLAFGQFDQSLYFEGTNPDPNVWTVTVNGETSLVLGSYADAVGYSRI